MKIREPIPRCLVWAISPLPELLYGSHAVRGIIDSVVSCKLWNVLCNASFASTRWVMIHPLFFLVAPKHYSRTIFVEETRHPSVCKPKLIAAREDLVPLLIGCCSRLVLLVFTLSILEVVNLPTEHKDGIFHVHFNPLRFRV